MKRVIILTFIILQIHSAFSQEKNICNYWGSYYTELNDSVEHIHWELSICNNNSFLITICDTYCNENWAINRYTGKRMHSSQIYGTYDIKQDTISFYRKEDSTLFLKTIEEDSLNLRIVFDSTNSFDANSYLNRGSRYSENHTLGDYINNIADLRWFLNNETMDQKKVYKFYYIPENSGETIFTIDPVIIRNTELYKY